MQRSNKNKDEIKSVLPKSDECAERGKKKCCAGKFSELLSTKYRAHKLDRTKETFCNTRTISDDEDGGGWLWGWGRTPPHQQPRQSNDTRGNLNKVQHIAHVSIYHLHSHTLAYPEAPTHTNTSPHRNMQFKQTDIHIR